MLGQEGKQADYLLISRPGICQHGRASSWPRSELGEQRMGFHVPPRPWGQSSQTLCGAASESSQVLDEPLLASGLPQALLPHPSAPHPPRERREGLSFSSLQGSMSQPTRMKSWTTRLS